MRNLNFKKLYALYNSIKINWLTILLLCILLTGCTGIVKNRILFEDECSGTSIDYDKWNIRIENGKNTELSHYNALELHTRKTDESSAIVKSSVGSEKGVFSFSAFSDLPVNLRTNSPLPVTTSFGLYIDANNRIEFYHKLEGNYMLAYRIVLSGKTVYEVENIAKEFGQFKIKVSERLISAYIWENDKWIMIGESQEQKISGRKYIFMSTAGVVPTKISLRDCYITSKDFTTVTPVAQTELDAADIRKGGAVPDGMTDCADIINKLLEEGNVVIQNGRFLVKSAILIPSHRTLYIRNATIRLDDQVFDNIFRNKDVLTGNNNVKILGLGNAVLDGNAKNNNTRSTNYTVPPNRDYRYSDEDRYKNNIGFFSSVSDFEISGLNEIDRAAYFMTLQDDSFGKIHDIYNSLYTLTQNQDGIQIIYGSHDIELYNISGYYGDDVTSIFLGTKRGTFEIETATSRYGDVHNIHWHDFDIYHSTYHSIIFICGDGNKIYNCKIENFNVNYNLFFTYLGLGDSYNSKLPEKDEFYNIKFDNIIVDSSPKDRFAQVLFNANMKNVTFTNFQNKTEIGLYFVKYSRYFSNPQSVNLTLENVFINGEQIKQ